jgi:hypothetical protein
MADTLEAVGATDVGHTAMGGEAHGFIEHKEAADHPMVRSWGRRR